MEEPGGSWLKADHLSSVVEDLMEDRQQREAQSEDIEGYLMTFER